MTSEQMVSITGFACVMLGINIVLGTAAAWVYLLTLNTAARREGSSSSGTDAGIQ